MISNMPCATRPSRPPAAFHQARLPEWARWATPKEVQANTGYHIETVYKMCREARLWALQHGGVDAPWRIAVDVNGQPLSPPCPSCFSVADCGCTDDARP
jgi:hypothetical protein